MFAELSIISNFTFLTGASHPEEYMMRAALLGLPAIAITDVNSVTGIVRAYSAARDIKRFVKDRQSKNSIGPPRPQNIKKPPSLSLDTIPRLIPGSKFKLIDGFEITVLPKSRKGWGTLCRCLSKGRLRNSKGLCDLVISEISEELDDVVLLIHSPKIPWNLKKSKLWLKNSTLLKNKFNQDVYIVLTPEYDGIDHKRFEHTKKLSKTIRCDLVASAHPIMHHSKRRKLADVLTAIRLGKSVDQLGKNALPNAERRLRSYTEILQIFSGYPEAINNTTRILDKLQFSLDELRYQYPLEINNGETPQKRLERLAIEGLNWRYPSGAPQKVQSMLNHELNLIGKLKYEPYFLTVHDIVTFARSRNILCQGRGSAANSVVCYCLGVTSVSPEIGTMVFERFVSEARDEPPDIDVDFEHERREEVIQYIYNRYGRHRAGLCSTVIHYRGKRAVREVGAAMGLSKDTVSALSSQLWGFFSTKKLEEKLQMQEVIQLKNNSILDKKKVLGSLNFKIALTQAELETTNKETDFIKMTGFKKQVEELINDIKKDVDELYSFQNSIEGLPISESSPSSAFKAEPLIIGVSSPGKSYLFSNSLISISTNSVNSSSST